MPGAVLVATPLRCANAVNARDLKLSGDAWGEAAINLPPELAGCEGRDSFTGEIMRLDAHFTLRKAFHAAPFSLIKIS